MEWFIEIIYSMISKWKMQPKVITKPAKRERFGINNI